MRRSFQLVSFAVVAFSATFVANTALAQKKPKDKQKADDGPSAAATWTDPIDQEKSDKGPYTPHKDDSDAPRPAAKHAPDKGRQRDKLVVFGQLIIGFGKAPENNPDFSPSNKGTVLGFQVGGRYDVSKDVTLGLRIPITTATVKQDTGQNLSTTAFGAPELLGEYRLSLSRLTSLPISFGVGVPIAQGNPDPTGSDTPGHAKDLVNRLADSTSGWKDSELFQPKRLPIIVGVGIHHDRKDWEAHADAKFVLLPALSTTVSAPNQDATLGTYKIRGFGMREVTTVGASYNILDKPLLYAGLDFSVIWTPIQGVDFDPLADVNRPSALQAVLEPKVGARFGAISPSVGYILPLGGRLGSGGNGGIRLLVSAAF
jgi:hypothetical protein